MMDAVAPPAEPERKLAGIAVDAAGVRAVGRDVVYVYEAPVRLWHWVNALAILVLGVTGYFIGSGTPTMSGEASDHFLFGYIRFAHFAAGYVLTVGFLLRVYWTFAGNHHARQLFFVPVWRKSWWEGVWHEIRWYTFLTPVPKKYVGHNPVGQMVFALYMLMALFMIITGFALYSQGAGNDSWQFKLFGWVFSILPNSQDVHTLHHLGLWFIVVFTIMHIYAAIHEDIMSRQSMVSSIISGERQFRD